MSWGDWAGGIAGGVAGGLPGAAAGYLIGHGGNPIDTAMGLIPGVNDSKEAQANYQKAVKELIDRIDKEWKLPNYEKTPLTPQEYKVLNQYAPQVAAFVQQAQPELLRNIQGQGEQAQRQALSQLGQLAQTGTDEGTKALYETANMDADQAMRANRANALALLASRGLGSSGATLGADISAGMGAAEQQRRASLQIAADAAARKAQAIQALGNLGSQVAQQDTQKQQFNANTLNQYNELLANRRQQYNDYAAQMANQAQMYNQQMMQNVANQNTALQNQYNMYNRGRSDTIEQNLANMENERLRTEAGLQSGSAAQQLQADQQNAKNKTNFFMGMLGLGAQAGMAAGTGGASAAGMAPAAASTMAASTPQYTAYNEPAYSSEYGGNSAVYDQGERYA